MDQPARGGVRGCLGNQEKEPLRNPGLDSWLIFGFRATVPVVHAHVRTRFWATEPMGPEPIASTYDLVESRQRSLKRRTRSLLGRNVETGEDAHQRSTPLRIKTVTSSSDPSPTSNSGED